MFDIYLQFEHDCPYSQLSRAHPNAKLALWDNFHREFLEARSTRRKDWSKMGNDLSRLAAKKGSKILRQGMEGGGYQFLVMTCACERRGSTLSMITESDSLFIPPIRISGGIETYHVVSFDKGTSARLLEAFGTKGKAKILSRRHLDIGSLDRSSLFPFVDPLSTLTPIQLDALVTSMSLGYYRLPRRTSTGKIAARLKVPRTTFQERRKKAESKLMSALAPYVLTYAGENSLR